MNVQHMKRAIIILEKRLQYDGDDADAWNEVFEPSTRCLYHYLLADAYFKLFTITLTLRKDQNINNKEAIYYGYQSLKVLEQGMKLGGESLEVFDKIRLLLIYLYCQVLCEVQLNNMKARLVAEHAFHSATAHTNVFDIQTNTVLQNLRDHFMTYVKMPEIIIEGSSDPSKEMTKAAENLEEEVAKMFKRKRSVKFKQLDDIKNQRENLMSSYNHPNKVIELARNVRRLVSLPVPVLLETLSSAAQILKALDRIFRVYVRGNALPGQLNGGNTVEMAGNILSFRNFVLHGPYMSWKGFCAFLLDFSIAQLPTNTTKLGKSFYRTFGVKDENDLIDGSNSNGPDPLVSFLEAAIIFAESSASTTPVLVLNKFMKLYADLAATIDFDPWSRVYDWSILPAQELWSIDVGVNFMQFVDCIGKLGAVGYSTTIFNEMLPTVNDKIEHFLSAFLGLSDGRKWAAKVDNKLKKSKDAIKKMSEKTS